jgi:hypothetical protein
MSMMSGGSCNLFGNIPTKDNYQLAKERNCSLEEFEKIDALQ